MDDFWYYEPKAGTRVLTTYYATGQVDASHYTPNVVSFATSPTHHRSQGSPCVNGRLRLVDSGLAAWSGDPVPPPRWHRPQTGAWIRSAGPIAFGLGGWFLGALFVLRFLSSVPLDSELLAVVSISVPIWLGTYAGWVRTDTPRAMRAKGIGAAGVGALVGAALGFHESSGLMAVITTIIGATVMSNLSLLVLDIWTEVAASRGYAAPAVDLSETEQLEPALH